MTSVDSSHLKALIRLHVRMLTGTQTDAVHPAHLGGIAHLLFNSSGWHLDGPARVRAFLDGGLDRLTISSRFISSRAENSSVALALRMVWGITTYPATLQATARRISDLKLLDRFGNVLEVDGDRISSWQARARESVPMLEWAQEESDLGDDDAAVADRVAAQPHERIVASEWPHGAVREELLALALASAGDLGKALTSDEQLIASLRHSIGQYLRRNYFQLAESTQIARHLLHSVVRLWEQEDVFLFTAASRTEATQGGGSYSRAAPAILRMLAYDLTAREPHLLRSAIKRLLSAEDMVSIVEMEPGARVLSLGSFPAEMRQAFEVKILESSSRSLDPLTLSPRALRAISRVTVPTRPVEALELSYAIKESPPEARSELIDVYLAARSRMSSMTADSDDSFAEYFSEGADTRESAWGMRRFILALADQSVHLDLVHLQDNPRAAELSQIMRVEGSDYGYAALADRNAGLIYSKSKEYAEAIKRMFVARRNAETATAEVLSSGIGDLLQSMETLHQIALSVTGVFTALIEDHLRMEFKSRVPDGLALQLRAALRWSWTTSSQLAEIEQLLGGELPSHRHFDNRHIVWDNWYVTTRQLRLRVLLAGHTAVTAKLINWPSAAHEAYDVSLTAVIEAYRVLIKSPQLDTAAARTIAKQGTWLAFLNNGRVPVAEHVSFAFRVHTEFLDADPTNVVGTYGDRVVDVLESAEWHNRDGDAGIIGRLPRKSVAALHLDTHSNGAFTLWRTALDATLRTEGGTA